MANSSDRSILNSTVSKRSFLAGAASAMALSTQSFSARRAMAQNSNWDLIVIGGGTAGMPAALFAAERGARVLLIDIAPQLGGTMDRSSGQVAAAGTVWQKEQGIEDSPDAHYDDVMRINRHTFDPRLTRLLVNNAADTLNWFAARGFKVLDGHPVMGGGHEPFTTRRYQWSPDRARAFQNIMDPMIEEAQASGRLNVLLDTGAIDLVQDESEAVVGVVTENDTGERVDYRSRFVLLTSGGCMSNPLMFENLHGVPLFCEVAYPYSQGQGITLGLGAGGFVRGGDKYATLFGTILESGYFPSPQVGTRSSRHNGVSLGKCSLMCMANASSGKIIPVLHTGNTRSVCSLDIATGPSSIRKFSIRHLPSFRGGRGRNWMMRLSIIPCLPKRKPWASSGSKRESIRTIWNTISSFITKAFFTGGRMPWAVSIGRYLLRRGRSTPFACKGGMLCPMPVWVLTGSSGLPEVMARQFQTSMPLVK